MGLVTLLKKGALKRGIKEAITGPIEDIVPIDHVIAAFKLARNPRNAGSRVYILEAKTASGKSVTVPPETYLQLGDGRSVVCTQPRTISAENTARIDVPGVPAFKDLVLGKNLGFQTRALTVKPQKGLIYMTIGTLTQQLKSSTDEQFMRKYSHVIIDEAHERTTDVDLALALLRALLSRVWQDERCPTVIAMSATLEIDRYAKYFGTTNIISVAGASHPIEECWGDPVEDSTTSAVSKCLEIHNLDDKQYTPNRDIMVFVTGAKPMRDISAALEENMDSKRKYIVLKLNSAINTRGGREVEALFGSLPNDVVRRIIISTPVAEVSVTIPTLRYVVDTGLYMSVTYNPRGVTVIGAKPVSQDMALQRKGRGGRTAPGVWFPMYDASSFRALMPAKLPEVFTSETTSMTLSLMIRDIPVDSLMDPIPMGMQRHNIGKLYSLGALVTEHHEGDKTFRLVPSEIGKLLDRFRVIPLEAARALIAAYEYEADIGALITIIAMIESGAAGRNYKPLGLLENDTMIDLALTYESILSKIGKRFDIEKVAEKHGLSAAGLRNAINMRTEITIDMRNIGFDTRSSIQLLDLHSRQPELFEEEVDKLRKCLLDGYRYNLLRNAGRGYWNSHIGNVFTPRGARVNAEWMVTSSVTVMMNAEMAYYTAIPSTWVDEYR
jgi:HrpA-like RNA helicase